MVNCLTVISIYKTTKMNYYYYTKDGIPDYSKSHVVYMNFAVLHVMQIILVPGEKSSCLNKNSPIFNHLAECKL